MTLASSNRASVAYIAESAFGTTPGVGTAKALRFTGESFSFDLSKEVSKEIRDDRQNTGATTVDASTTGSLNFETSYKEYDALIEAALQSSFTAYGTAGVGASFTADFTATTITNTGAALTGNDAFTVLQKGQWFLLSTGGANDGKFFRVSGTVAPSATVITLDASTPAVVAVGVTTCKVKSSRLTNGTTLTTFSIEKAFADVAQFMLYRGMGVSKMALKFAAASLSTGSFDFMGKDMVRAGVTGLPSAPSASQTYGIQNGVRGIGQLWEGSAPLSGTYIKSLDVNVDNNLRMQTALQNLGAVGLGVGDFKTTGSFSAYFADGTQYDKFLSDEYTALTVGTQDASKNGYVLTMPYIQLMTAKVVAGSKNTDIMADFTYEAFADLSNATSALRKALFIDRVGA